MMQSSEEYTEHIALPIAPRASFIVTKVVDLLPTCPLSLAVCPLPLVRSVKARWRRRTCPARPTCAPYIIYAALCTECNRACSYFVHYVCAFIYSLACSYFENYVYAVGICRLLMPLNVLLYPDSHQTKILLQQQKMVNTRIVSYPQH